MTRATIQEAQGVHRISRHVYGHFAEHLGRCIYEGIWVGPDSRIPNRNGIRSDVVDALRRIRVPNLRWPGGCFADTYHWRDGIGPKSGRPSIVNTHWGGVTENNHFGTHEFMELVEQVGCDPYICGNVGSGTVREMAEWIEYLTFAGASPMADLRRANGRDAAWKVPFWGVGNENWGCGGQMRPEYYADLYLNYQCYCKEYSGNQLTRIAGGAAYENYAWTRVLMERAADVMQGLSLHYYVVPGTWQEKSPATGFSRDQYFAALEKALFMTTLVEKHGAIMDEYDKAKRIPMVVDEWGIWLDVEPGTNPGFLYQQNSMRDALVAAVTLDIFNNHCDRVRMANLAQTVNVLQSVVLTKEDRMILTPTWHVFDLYKEHQDAVMLPVTLNTEHIRHGGVALPALSASASCSADGTVHLTLVNLDPDNPREATFGIEGRRISMAAGRIVRADEYTACNTFEEPERVSTREFDDVRISGGSLVVTLPPASVAALRVG